jgi:hypothetical protein
MENLVCFTVIWHILFGHLVFLWPIWYFSGQFGIFVANLVYVFTMKNLATLRRTSFINGFSCLCGTGKIDGAKLKRRQKASAQPSPIKTAI